MTRKEYQKKYHKVWYNAHKKYHRTRINIRRIEIRKWVNEIKSELKCEQCPESHVATLDFHHIIPSRKEFQISRAIADGWSKDKILAEIKKCKVLCANCHRKLHWNEI